MSACDQEMCPSWTGSGCVCAVLDLERMERCPRCGWPTNHGDCGQCGFVSYVHGCPECDNEDES